MPERQGTVVANALEREEKFRAQDLLYNSILGTREVGVNWIAFGLAVVLHVMFMLINFPDLRSSSAPERGHTYLVVKKYVPPPPPVQRRQVVRRPITRKLPIPDPTPQEPEPIREPESAVIHQPIPADVELLIGTPEPPAPEEPETLFAGIGGVTNPRLIEGRKIVPEYPELARLARVEGNVALQAVVCEDGSVAEVEVLRCNRPKMGFEESAIAAVQQWRYEPATQGGRAVQVYFTVFIQFTLQQG